MAAGEAIANQNAEVPEIVGKRQNFNYDSILAGALAGAICTITCSPLDVTKVRMQVQGSLGLQKYRGSLVNIVATIYAEEGFRGFFRGIGPALVTVPLFWGS